MQLNNSSGLVPDTDWLLVDKPFVTVRILDQIFHLDDGEDVSVGPFYLQSYDDVLTHFTVAGSTLGPVVTFDSVSIRRMLGLLLPVT